MAVGLVLASASPRRREILSHLELPFVVQPADVDETPLAGETPAAMVLRLSRAKASKLSPASILRAGMRVAGDTKLSPADSLREEIPIAGHVKLSHAGVPPHNSDVAGGAMLSSTDVTRDNSDVMREEQLSPAGVPPNNSGVAGDSVIIIAADTTVALDGLIIGKPTDAADAEHILRQLRGRMHQVFTGLTLSNPQVREWSALCETRVYMRAYDDAELLAYVASGEVYDKAGAYAIQDALFHPVERIEGCYLNVMGLPLCEVINGLRALGIDTNQTEPIPHDTLQWYS